MNDVLDIIGAMDEPVGYWSPGGDPVEFYCPRCDYIYLQWSITRELLEAIAEHMRDAHPEVRNTP